LLRLVFDTVVLRDVYGARCFSPHHREQVREVICVFWHLESTTLMRHKCRAPIRTDRGCVEDQPQRPTKEGFVFVAKELKRHRGSIAQDVPSRGRDAFHPRPKLLLATFEIRRRLRVWLKRSCFHVALTEVVRPPWKIWGPCGNGPYHAAVGFEIAVHGVWFLGSNVKISDHYNPLALNSRWFPVSFRVGLIRFRSLPGHQ
jgi:hypothetical protein